MLHWPLNPVSLKHYTKEELNVKYTIIDADKNPIISLKKLYYDTKKSAFKLNKFYKGAIKVKPFYWRQIIK